MARLSEVCTIQGGSQPPKAEWFRQPGEGLVRMLQIRDFTQGAPPEYVRMSPKLRLCTEDDILLARYGASLGKVLTGLAGAYNVAMLRLRPDESMLSRDYLRYFLSSPPVQQRLLAEGGRAAQAGCSIESVGALPLPLPSLAAQAQITRRLDTVCRMIDLRRGQIQQLNLLPAARLTELCGDPLHPKQSEVIPFGSVCRQLHQGVNTTGEHLQYQAHGIPVLQAKHILHGNEHGVRYVSDADFARYEEKYCPRPGSLLLTNIGTLGAAFAVRERRSCLVAWNILMAEPDDRLLPDTAVLCIRQLSDMGLFKGLQSGAAVPFLSKQTMEALPMLVPPMSVQEEIASCSAECRAAASAMTRSLTELEALYEAMLAETFRVCNG